MINYTISPKGISLVVDNRMRVVPVGSLNFIALKNALKTKEPIDVIRSLIDIPSFISKFTFGRVSVGTTPNGQEQVQFDGDPVNSIIADRIIDLVTEGFDVEPLARFLDRLMDNPLESARNELYLFIESGDFVLTPDGHFLAFKKVRDDYKDIYTGTYDNSVGRTLKMERLDVDPDRSRTCSVGLHFCSYSYLPHFGVSSGNRVVIVKIDPADVVAIPSDYKNAKGRTWRYTVVGEVPEGENTATFFNGTMVTDSYETVVVDGDPEDFDDTMEDVSYDSNDSYDSDYGEEEESSDLSFTTSDGRTILDSELREAVDNYGQRGASRLLNVPRSTIWGWLNR